MSRARRIGPVRIRGSHGRSQVTWEIEQMGEVSRLRLVHDEFADESTTFSETGEG